MLRPKRLLLLAIIVLIAMAGCTPEPPVVDSPEPAKGIQFTATSTPQPSKAGEQLRFVWEITAEEGTVALSTAVRYGRESTPGELGKDITPADTTYDRVPTAHVSVLLPDTFTSSLWTGSEGTLYYRFHAVIDGDNYWSDEYSVEITPEIQVVDEPEPVPEVPVEKEPEPEDTVSKHIIIVKDDAFEPQNLTIMVGDTIRWKNERETAQATRGSALLLWHSRSDGYSSADFKSGTFYPGETWEFTFEKEGKLAYQDAIFINAGIIGIITVEP